MCHSPASSDDDGSADGLRHHQPSAGGPTGVGKKKPALTLGAAPAGVCVQLHRGPLRPRRASSAARCSACGQALDQAVAVAADPLAVPRGRAPPSSRSARATPSPRCDVAGRYGDARSEPLSALSRRRVRALPSSRSSSSRSPARSSNGEPGSGAGTDALMTELDRARDARPDVRRRRAARGPDEVAGSADARRAVRPVGQLGRAAWPWRGWSRTGCWPTRGCRGSSSPGSSAGLAISAVTAAMTGGIAEVKDRLAAVGRHRRRAGGRGAPWSRPSSSWSSAAGSR